MLLDITTLAILAIDKGYVIYVILSILVGGHDNC